MIFKGRKKRMAVLLILMLIAVSLASCTEKQDLPEENVVKVYCFGDYFDPDLVDRFEKETGIHVILDTFDTNEEMYPVIEKGSVKYDVICASDYMISKMRSKDLLARIDRMDIPNRKNIDKRYLKLSQQVDPENRYALPHTVGTMGIMYDSGKIRQGEITSWKDLWKKKYTGQVVMPDSMRDTMGIALKAQGHSINDVDEKHIEQASEYLAKQKPIVYKYANDSVRDMLIGGYCDIGVVWNGEVLYSQEENPNLKFVIPQEGSEAFFDMWAIPANAEHKDNGAKWIDFMLSHSSAEANFQYLTYSIPDSKVIERVKADDEMSQVLFDQNSLKKCQILEPLTVQQEDMLSTYWKKFKTTAKKSPKL